jgi:hypothetical protein
MLGPTNGAPVPQGSVLIRFSTHSYHSSDQFFGIEIATDIRCERADA